MRNLILCAMVTMAFTGVSAQTYNNLWIPDTLSGTTFNLKLKDSSVQYLSGKATATSGINKDAFWGPTLFINKGDSVHMNVLNSMGDTTTIHWHGMHLAPVMDGGPHQPIPPSTLWQPYWKMMNNAATFWYHPHITTDTRPTFLISNRPPKSFTQFNFIQHY